MGWELKGWCPRSSGGVSGRQQHRQEAGRHDAVDKRTVGLERVGRYGTRRRMGREDECMRGRTDGSRPWPLPRFVPPEKLEVRRTDDETVLNPGPFARISIRALVGPDRPIGRRTENASHPSTTLLKNHSLQTRISVLCLATTQTTTDASRTDSPQGLRLSFAGKRARPRLFQGDNREESNPSLKEQVIGRVGSSWSRSPTRVRSPFRRTRP